MVDLLFTTTVSGVPSTDILFSSEAYSAPETNFDFIDGSYIPGDYDFEFDPTIFKTIYRVLKGTNDNFNSVWADADASLTNGKFYFTSPDMVQIVNLTTNKVWDYYTQDHGGRAQEKLNSDDIVDINVT